MVINSLSVLLLIVLFLFLSSVNGYGINQIEALKNLYNAKFNNRGLSVSTTINLEQNLNVEDVEILPQDGLKESDKIVKFPFQPPVKFDQYGGYVTVNQKAGRALFYYFAEAEQRKESLPLLLWLNGGPGCSSLAYGAMEELGPFRVLSDGKTLYKNLFGWNHAANVLFLESPVGVGFSYSNTTSDYKNRGDSNTATDNYAFLLNWLERFPEYNNRDFYISGESYAGHYVPQLAKIILHHNQKANKTPINLKGIIIGNALIDDGTIETGVYDFLKNHAIISDETFNDITKYCDFSPSATTSDPMCDAAKDIVNEDTRDIRGYSIYSPVCINSNLTSRPKKVSYEIDPCSGFYVYAYLNRPDVQEAIHANVTKLDHDWHSCSVVLEDWVDWAPTVLPLLREFMANGLRVWIFSGDTDSVVPFTSTKLALALMKLQVKTPWHPWLVNQQVGGFTEEYEGNLTFVTVRGAGHEVPSYQPRRSLSLITHFLMGTPLPRRKLKHSLKGI